MYARVRGTEWCTQRQARHAMHLNSQSVHLFTPDSQVLLTLGAVNSGKRLTRSRSAGVMIDPRQDCERQEFGEVFFGSEVAPAFKPAITRADGVVLNDCGGVTRAGQKGGNESAM